MTLFQSLCRLTEVVKYFLKCLVILGFVTVAHSQTAIPTIWDSMPKKDLYGFFKKDSSGENKKVFEFYESKQFGKLIAACVPNAYGYYVVAKSDLTIKNKADAESAATSECKGEGVVLLGYSTTPDAKSSNYVESSYKDKFTGKTIPMHDLFFKEARTNGYDEECSKSCVAWIWPDAVVINGKALITGGASFQMTNIPTKLRLGNKVYVGKCVIQDNGDSCSLEINGLQGKALSDAINNHQGEIALEFKQYWTSLNLKQSNVTVWATEIKKPRPVENVRF